MGILEKQAKEIRRRVNMRKIVLQTIATAGVLSVALVAPNALQVLKMFDGNKMRKLDPKYHVNNVFAKLLSQKLIVIKQTPKGKFVCLTKDGAHVLAGIISRSPDSRKNRVWDKRWRMLMYDIHEEKKGTRIKLRRTIQSFGFERLQNSVWVYPYDCEDLIILLKADFKIGQEVLYCIVEKIENDKKLKEHFGLL